MALAKPAVVDTNVVVAGVISGSPSSPPVIITRGMLTGRFLLRIKDQGSRIKDQGKAGVTGYALRFTVLAVNPLSR